MFRIVGKSGQVPTFRDTTALRRRLQARWPGNWKSAVRKRGPIKRFVENQLLGIEPCGLVRVPAGSCGKIRTPAGSRWGGTLRQTYV